MKNKINIFVLQLFILLGISGCSYITHEANIDDGFRFVVAGGPLNKQYYDCTSWCDNYGNEPDPDESGWGTAYQAEIGYGWKFDSGKGLQLNLPISIGESVGYNLDGYFQLLSSPIDFGIGGIVGTSRQAYMELGKQWNSDNIRFGVSGGIKIDEVTLNPFLLASLRRKSWVSGIFLDTRSPASWNPPGSGGPDYIKGCDEVCRQENVYTRVTAGGVFIGRIW